ACALALKNIEILEEENLVENSATQGKKLLDGLSELTEHPVVGNVRGKGLMIGIELVEDKETKIPADPEKISQVIAFCKKEGVIIGNNSETVAGYANILQISPPLTITDEEVELIIITLKKAFAQI